MNTAILGNGPSLNLSQEMYQDFDCIIITNRLIWEELSFLNARLIYVCADIRFNKSVEWKKQLEKKSFETYLSDELYQEVQGFCSIKNIFSYSSLNGNALLNQYLEDFPLMQNLQANVVLDFAIPVAILIGSTNIQLFGCDFDYEIKTNNDIPSYYSNYILRDISFDHNQNSANIWANVSKNKYTRIVSTLYAAGIVLSK